MNVTRVLGAFAVGLVALGTITAQADSRNWTGASEENKNWSTAENWSGNTAPTASDTAVFGTAAIVLDTEGDGAHVGAFSVSKDAKVSFTGDNKSLVTSTANSAIGEAAEIALEATNAIVTVNGAKNTLAKNAKVSVKGANSVLTVNNAYVSGSGNKNVFSAEDGAVVALTLHGDQKAHTTLNHTIEVNLKKGDLSWTGTTTKSGNLTVRLNAESAYANMQGSSINGGKVQINFLSSTAKFSGFNTAHASTLRLTNSCIKTDWDFKIGTAASTIEMSGKNPYIRSSGGGMDIKASTTVTLIPELSWDQKNASGTDDLYALFYAPGTGNSSAVYFRDTWKCTVDVSKFAHYYGTKKILVAYTATAKTRNFYLPVVTVVGEGSENCKVTFSRDKAYNTSNYMWMTIESQNPPEGSMARIVRNGTKYYYNSIEEAFAAAQANDTVSPIANVSLTNTVTVGKAVTLDPNTFCVSGDSLAAAPFIVTDGALTVSGSGTIDGGANAAVRVTGGAFYSPVASQVTYSSANDAVVVYNAGTAPTVEICGGNFVSTEGQPVASSAAEGSDPLVGFLEGGTYNKEPTAVLIRDGYKSQQVGDLWEVVLEGPAICKVGDRYYASLQKAYDAVPNYGDIFIVADATVAPLTLNRKIDVGIDVSGHTLTSAEGNTLFTVEGDALHLWDNPTTGPTGSFNGGVVLNSGTLEIDVHVTIKAEPALTVNGGTADKVFGTLNGGVVMNGGSLTLNATVNSEGVAISANSGALNVASGSYTGGTSAFVAGPDFTAQCVDTGSFSSAIPAQHLKGNRKMEQQGGVWVVMLASDEKNVTYTWQGGAVGDWANPANWKPSLTPCFGVPSNKYATASFASSSANIVVNLGGGDYPIGALSYAHYYRQTITNGSFKLQSGALNGDRRLIVKDAVVTVADPVYANAQGFNFQLNGDAKVVGDVAPHKDAKKLGKYDESYNGLVCIGSNEVTGVVHNRNTQLNVNVQEDSTLVVGEIKSDSNSTYLTPVITVAKTGKLNVRECKSGDFSGGIKFTFNVPATGLDSAPVSFLKNDDNVGLTEYTALTVNVDEGFKTGRIPLISGTWLSANDVRKILSGGDYGPLVVNGKFPKGTKFGLQSKNGVISLLVKSAAMVISVQ